MEKTSIDELALSRFTRVGAVWRSAQLLAAALLLMQAPAALAQQQHSLPCVQRRRLRAGRIPADHQPLRSRRHGAHPRGRRFRRALRSRHPVGLASWRPRTSTPWTWKTETRARGFRRGIGDGEGDWRLELSTDLDIEPLAYIRTSDGFVTSVHDVVQPEVVPAGSNPGGAVSPILYHVRFFNPGSNAYQVSRLRLINASGTETAVTITGTGRCGRLAARRRRERHLAGLCGTHDHRTATGGRR